MTLRQGCRVQILGPNLPVASLLHESHVDSRPSLGPALGHLERQPSRPFWRTLSSYGQRYSFDDNTLYETLTDRLLTRRNRLMAERMQAALEAGNAFVAVGALHLPGEEGILALLERRGFEITRVF